MKKCFAPGVAAALLAMHVGVSFAGQAALASSAPSDGATVYREVCAPFGRPLVTAPAPQTMCVAKAGEFANPLYGSIWNGWGTNNANTRFQDRAGAGLTAAQVPRLKLKWAFGFPGDVAADAQPAVVGGRVFVGSQSGNVYALDAATGCLHWYFTAGAAVRAAVTIARVDMNGSARDVAFIGDFQDAAGALADIDIEMIAPEIDEHFVELTR
jgi:polyvinyl alcohol dehydrogenase (cytochrome)